MAEDLVVLKTIILICELLIEWFAFLFYRNDKNTKLIANMSVFISDVKLKMKV